MEISEQYFISLRNVECKVHRIGEGTGTPPSHYISGHIKGQTIGGKVGRPLTKKWRTFLVPRGWTSISSPPFLHFPLLLGPGGGLFGHGTNKAGEPLLGRLGGWGKIMGMRWANGEAENFETEEGQYLAVYIFLSPEGEKKKKSIAT